MVTKFSFDRAIFVFCLAVVERVHLPWIGITLVAEVSRVLFGPMHWVQVISIGCTHSSLSYIIVSIGSTYALFGQTENWRRSITYSCTHKKENKAYLTNGQMENSAECKENDNPLNYQTCAHRSFRSPHIMHIFQILLFHTSSRK